MASDASLGSYPAPLLVSVSRGILGSQSAVWELVGSHEIVGLPVWGIADLTLFVSLPHDGQAGQLEAGEHIGERTDRETSLDCLVFVLLGSVVPASVINPDGEPPVPCRIGVS